MDFGLIIDLETTGLNPESDRIIELGIIEFGLEGNEPPAIIRSYSAVEDPGFALAPEITKITGLTNAIVSGQAIDWQIVSGFFSRAQIVIAHNCDFDRSFLVRRAELKTFRPHWACSMRHIDWRKHDFKTQSLNYLAADHGFVNPFAHRALFDCATTFRLVSPYIQELIERSFQREYMLKAVESPFASRDVLRARGYRWDSNERCWGRVIVETELETERQFLANEVYKGLPRHEEIELKREF